MKRKLLILPFFLTGCAATAALTGVAMALGAVGLPPKHNKAEDLALKIDRANKRLWDNA